MPVLQPLENLRQLLGVVEDRERTENIAQQLENYIPAPEALAPALPNAILQADKETMPAVTAAFYAPVQRCIEQGFKQEPKRYAELLGPLLGPAIRKSISDNLQSFMVSLNRMVEQSVSPRGLAWRLEAMRTGLPYTEIVMRHSLLYRVEQAFLIHSNTGLLVAHLAQPDASNNDNDAVSGMLTAIQDFVSDTFSKDSAAGLESVDIGDFTLWLVNGRTTRLAVAVRGIAPSDLRLRLQDLHDNIESQFAFGLDKFDGDASQLPGIVNAMEPVLVAEHRDGNAKKGPPWPAIIVLSAIALIFVLWFAVASYRQHRLDALVQHLRAEPGYVLTEVQRDGTVANIAGLRDPLARPLALIAKEKQWELEDIVAKFSAYQSLDNRIVVLRAARLLDTPESVNLSMKNGELIATGSANQAWKTQAMAQARFLPGVDNIDTSGLVTEAEMARKNLLVLLSSSTMRLEFESGTQLRAASEIRFQEFLRQLKQALMLSQTSGQNVELSITGSTDISGSIEQNRRYAINRAQAMWTKIQSEITLPAHTRIIIKGTPGQELPAEQAIRAVQLKLSLPSSLSNKDAP
jgi:hypothetical protein